MSGARRNGERERIRQRRREGAGEAGATRRRSLMALLRAHTVSFEDLRRALLVAPRVLEDDLRHVERSARTAGLRLRVEPAQCRECGFAFPGRRRLAPPGRCPSCRKERIEDARLHLEGDEVPGEDPDGGA